MLCLDPSLLHWRFFLLLSSWLAEAASLAANIHPGGGVKSQRSIPRPITRREPSSSATSLVALAEATQHKACPGGVTCGEKADNLVWDQACWDCLNDYQEFFCEKSSLTSPYPTFVDVCAKEGQYRGAFCKKFAEMEPPEYYQDCFFEGSEYKQIYCEKLKLKGTFNSACASDADVGTSFCEGFATEKLGFVECHGWPGFMMLYCETKQKSSIWDVKCANNKEIGATYCEDFALQGDIKAECEQYPSYLTLFCDIKASSNVTEPTCASSDHTAGMYCQELALKKNGFQDCWATPQFGATFCAEISWTHSACEAMAVGGQMNT